MKSKSKWFVFLIVAITMAIVVFSIFNIFFPSPYSDTSGWFQVLIAAIGLPILLWELNNIRQSISQKPLLKIGLANVNNFPISNIRSTEHLNSETTISEGYPHFMLLVKNSGNVSAKFIKIHLALLNTTQITKNNLLTPVVKINSDINSNNVFQKENNCDFVFNGGTNWIIRPNDIEVFNFYLSTVVVKQKEPYEIHENPMPCDCEFSCTLWAEGINHPISEKLIVRVRQ